MLCPRVYPQLTHTVPRIHKLRQRPVTEVCTAKVSKGRSQSPLVASAGAKSPCDKKKQVTQEKHTPKISIAKRGYGEKSQIPLSSILPRKSAFEKPENSPNSLPSASWCIKIGLQKRSEGSPILICAYCARPQTKIRRFRIISFSTQLVFMRRGWYNHG